MAKISVIINSLIKPIFLKRIAGIHEKLLSKTECTLSPSLFKIALKQVDSLSSVGRPTNGLYLEILKTRSLGPLLCGQRAEVFARVLEVTYRDEIRKGNFAIARVFLTSGAVFRFHEMDIPIKILDEKLQNPISVVWDENELGTHGVVEVWIAGWGNFLVDPTINAVYEGTAQMLRKRSVGSNDLRLVDGLISGSRGLIRNRVQTDNAGYRIFYATEIFWASVNRQNYVRCLDDQLAEFL